MIDYGKWLQHELEKRRQKNAAYSLRAFSRTLKISPAALSRILTGKRPITLKLAVRVADSFGLSQWERQRFLAPLAGDRSNVDDRQFTALPEDEFALIADWHHYAILSLGQLKTCRFDPSWVARQLGITEKIAAEALERLLRLGIIVREGVRYRQVGQPLMTKRDVPSSAVRQHHRQLLKKATDAVDSVEVEDRDLSAITFPVDPERLSEAKEMIQEFRRRLAKVMGDGAKSQVYALSIALFPLSRARASRRILS